MVLYPLILTLAMLAPELTDTQKSDLEITLGSVSQTKSGYLTVLGPKERAHRKSGTHQDASLQFRYRGPSKQTSKLASGEVVRQIGLKMRAKNSCNLLYVMWRIEPVEQIVVTVKSNPGHSSHSDCGVRGYTTIAKISLEEVGITARTHSAHRLRARVEEENGNFQCIVDVDDKTVWSGSLETRVVAPINGPVGFRSDNGSFIFKLFVDDESR